MQSGSLYAKRRTQKPVGYSPCGRMEGRADSGVHTAVIQKAVEILAQAHAMYAKQIIHAATS